MPNPTPFGRKDGMQLNLREKEAADIFGEVPLIKARVLAYVDHDGYGVSAREVLGVLATALDFRRSLARPAEGPPFSPKTSPREVYPLFMLTGPTFIFQEYVAVGIHASGIVAVFPTALTVQVQKWVHNRYISAVATWSATCVPWVISGEKFDCRASKLPLPKAEDSVTNMDLYPYFLDYAISSNS